MLSEPNDQCWANANKLTLINTNIQTNVLQYGKKTEGETDWEWGTYLPRLRIGLRLWDLGVGNDYELNFDPTPSHTTPHTNARPQAHRYTDSTKFPAAVIDIFIS